MPAERIRVRLSTTPTRTRDASCALATQKKMKATVFTSILCYALLFASGSYARDLGYDPQADPFDQYHEAMEVAALENKNVLIIAGGDWCRWCHVLERFIAKNADIERGLTDAFVVMKVYVGPDNFNEGFFAQLPTAFGAPHFWVVSKDREVLGSQSTAKLERGKSTYDKASFFAFIEQWKSRGSKPQQHANARSSAGETSF